MSDRHIDIHLTVISHRGPPATGSGIDPVASPWLAGERITPGEHAIH